MKQETLEHGSEIGLGTRSRSLLAAAFVAALGLLLLWTAGFANPATLHEAAHDSRHAFSFPCH